MMRQAGRYLPEYKATRAERAILCLFCRNADLALCSYFTATSVAFMKRRTKTPA